MFTPYKGEVKMKWGPKKASQVLTYGAVVDQLDGYITVAAIASQSHSGIVLKTILAADSDYASATRIPYLMPARPTTEFQASVLSTDTAVATDVGNFFDLAGSPVGIDVTRATSNDDAFVVSRFFSANLVAGYLNSLKAWAPGIGTAI